MTEKIYLGALGATHEPQKLIISHNQATILEREFGKKYVEDNFIIQQPIPTIPSNSPKKNPNWYRELE